MNVSMQLLMAQPRLRITLITEIMKQMAELKAESFPKTKCDHSVGLISPLKRSTALDAPIIGLSIANLRGGATDAQIAAAPYEQVGSSLIEVAKDFFRGLSPIGKTPARQALNGEVFAIDRGRAALIEHRDYWIERKRREVEADREEYNRMVRVYGKMSSAECEQRIGDLAKKAASLRQAGSNEFDGMGGRRSRAATSNEAARGLSEQQMCLERYCRSRFATPATDD